MKNEEDICARCGACCYEKFIFNDEVVITDVPCEYYDEAASRCRIYDRRQELNPRCQSAVTARDHGALPASCPYAKLVNDYVGAISLSERPDYAEVLDVELDELRADLEKRKQKLMRKHPGLFSDEELNNHAE